MNKKYLLQRLLPELQRGNVCAVGGKGHEVEIDINYRT